MALWFILIMQADVGKIPVIRKTRLMKYCADQLLLQLQDAKANRSTGLFCLYKLKYTNVGLFYELSKIRPISILSYLFVFSMQSVSMSFLISRCWRMWYQELLLMIRILIVMNSFSVLLYLSWTFSDRLQPKLEKHLLPSSRMEVFPWNWHVYHG